MSTFYTRKQAGKFLHDRYGTGSYSWLGMHALHGTGPRFCRLGRRTVVYEESELIEWAEAHLKPTATRRSGLQPA